MEERREQLNVVFVARNSTSKKKLKSMNRIALTEEPFDP
jgi:hypothetical protein